MTEILLYILKTSRKAKFYSHVDVNRDTFDDVILDVAAVKH